MLFSDLSRRQVLQTCVASLGLSAMGASHAQAWPSKPIRLVLPSGAGGGADLFGRPMADFLSKELGVPLVVENKPGANGIVAHEAVVRQPPDGYSLLVSYPAAMLGNRLLQPKMSHDTLLDLKPIAKIGGGGGNLLVCHPDFPARNVKEMVAYVKTQEGGLNYGSWGIASGGHLAMELVKNMAGIKLNHVPYKTVAQIPPDLLSGVLMVSSIDSGTPIALIKAGRLRALAALSTKRLPQLLDVPTLSEQGIPFEVETWYGVFGPAGLPNDIVVRLNGLLNRWMVTPEVAALFEQKQNSPAPVPLPASELSAWLPRELAVWQKLVTDSKVTL